VIHKRTKVDNTTILERYPYAVALVSIGFGPTRIMLDGLNLTHGTDYLYWYNAIMFKDAENATMYKLMQGT
jgi:hypothetical protein